MLDLSTIGILLLCSAGSVLCWHDLSRPRCGCLCQKDVDEIIGNWAALFVKSDPSQLPAIVDATVADDFTATDNGINFLFGPPGDGPYANNKAEFKANIEIISPLTTKETFASIATEFNCHTITYRWQATAIAAGPTAEAPNITAVAGSQFGFKGTDLLVVAQGSKLLQSAQSSGDYLNYLYWAGMAVSFQINVPNTTSIPINLPAAGY